MKKQILTDSSLLIAVSPGTVYISTNPDHSSYANIEVVIQNQGSSSLSVNSISVTLPAALAPESGLSSITPSAGQPELWGFGPSDFTVGEFDAIPANGENVIMQAQDTWTFSLQMVTLVSTITQSSADVTVVVTFADGSSSPASPTIEIDPAIANIISFNAPQSNIDPGQAAQLTWSCEDISYCILSPVDDTERQPSGTYTVSPETQTAYTLYAFGDGVILSAQWTITVQNAQIVQFGGANAQSAVNYGDSITLVWECNQYTETIILTDNTGLPLPPLDGNGNTPQKGSIIVGPIVEPVIFTFTAYGDTKENFDQRNPNITINNLVYTMSSSPTGTVWGGDNVTLTWNIESASAVSVSPAIPNGPSLQNLSGSAIVNPQSGITYMLTVSGFINNVPALNQTLPVVLDVQPIVLTSFTISPTVINPDSGSSSGTLQWNTQAQSVSIDNGLGSQPAASSLVLDNPPNGTVYTLTIGSDEYPDQQTQQVIIANTYGPYTFNAFAAAPIGQQFTIPNPGAMADLKQGLDGGYTATLTGVIATGTPPAGYLALAASDTDPALIAIWPWPVSESPISFEWADPNNQTGTITLGPRPDGALEALNEELKAHDWFNAGACLKNKKTN